MRNYKYTAETLTQALLILCQKILKQPRNIVSERFKELCETYKFKLLFHPVQVSI